MLKKIALSLMALPVLVTGAEIDEIRNFTAYSPAFASAGQPTLDQLQAARDEGFEQVIYIAMTNSRTALTNEDVVVKELGMEYVHIPVIWDAPTPADFAAFASIMQRDPTRKTLLHCAANYRASAFSFLYRVIYEDVPVATAKADMNAVWTPNETWRDLIFEVLSDHGISPDCPGCDWSPGE